MYHRECLIRTLWTVSYVTEKDPLEIPREVLQLLTGFSLMIPKLQGGRSIMLFLSAKIASLTVHPVGGLSRVFSCDIIDDPQYRLIFDKWETESVTFQLALTDFFRIFTTYSVL